MSLLIVTLLLGAEPASPPPKLAERLQALNLEEARKWEMFLDESHTAKAVLVEKPVFLWTNPLPRFGLQHGSVFLWLHEGRPMVVGSIFGHPVDPVRRRLVHEFHSLAPTELSAVCHDEPPSQWQPKAGLAMEPVPEAPAPEATPTRRMIQLRALAREFSGRTLDHRKERWQLRILPQPLYRYVKPQGNVLDGALLALVTDAGTDPEVLLLLEARKDDGDSKGQWHYALLRFCDASVWISHRGKEVWTAVRDSENVQLHNPDHTYQVFQKRHVELSEDETGATQP
jgi:hypothetical protein